MRKKIIYILWAIVLSIGVGVLAQTTFDLEELFFTTTGIETWDYAGLHFNFSGNNFAGMVFFGTGIDLYTQQILELSWTTISCQKQINWFYINPARWNRIWPLDTKTLEMLKETSGLEWYNNLEIEWWFFTECIGTGVNTWEVYGYIKHILETINYELRAGVDFCFPSGSPIQSFSGTLNYINIPNQTASGFIYDKNWWTAKVISSMWFFARAEFGEWVEWEHESSQIATWYNIVIDLFSNKNASYEITWDISTSPITGTLTGNEVKHIEISLIDWLESPKTIHIKITEEENDEEYTKDLVVTIIDIEKPTVDLTFPNSWNTISNNSLNLERTGSDNFWISYYSVYFSGMWINYSSWQINYPTNTLNIWPLENGEYSRYVVATDIGNNTGQSEIQTFIISGDALWPTLISPSSWDSVEIWNLNLLREALYNASSWYTRQISKNNSFNNILASGHTNTTGVSTITHHPDFMTGSFYWRVLDTKTAGVSEHRPVQILDLIDGVDTEIEQLNFDTITWANLSQVYSSNTGIISGLTNNVSVLAKLENNIWALFVNNIMVGSQFLVKNGDEIKIELISKNAYNSWVSTKLIVWTWESLISGNFTVYTKTWTDVLDNSWRNLPYSLRIQAILFVDSLAEMYKYNPDKFANFLTTFQSILKDKSDLLANSISQSSNEQEIAFLNVQKLSVDYLKFVVDEYLSKIDYSKTNIYIAPNGKEYMVQFDDNRFAYTSPNFMYPKWFPTRELFKRHIDINNPWNYYFWTGDTITAPNNKKYIIYTENNKRTSNNFIYKKYFDTRDQIIEHIYINNPPATWDHNIDTNFNPVTYIAPNGKSYTIFKTASTWNNSNKYSSFMFLNPKYFSSLESAKNHINSENKK